MARLLMRGVLLHHAHTILHHPLGFFAPSAIQSASLVFDHIREFSIDMNFLKCQSKFVTDQLFSTSTKAERLWWEGSSRAILLRKLEIALKDHRVHDAWVTFNDFKRLYGFPTGSLVSKLITELSYSTDPYWLQKACNLVSVILKEKSDLLHHEVLTKLSLCLARAQMPVPASMILRVMLERECIPPVNVLWLVVSHMVKTDIGACLASNFLVQLCDYFLCLHQNRNDRAKVVKPDTIIFNLVLDACVRFKSSLKGQQIVELMSQVGVIGDAHSIIIIAQIHEMNGQRDELRKFKDHVDQVSAPFLCHYRQFYDCLLSLHFKFDDIDAAAELVFDIHRSMPSIQRLGNVIQKRCLVPIGSHNLRSGLKMQIMPELLQKDSIIKVEHKQELVILRNGKLLLSNKAIAKLLTGYKRHGKINELSKLLLGIQEDYQTQGSSLCSEAIHACICLGWLEVAHDMLDDMKTAGFTMMSGTCMALLAAYYNREMFKEAEVLLRQMRKAGLVINLSGDMVASTSLSEAADNALSSISTSDLANFVVRELQEEERAIPSVIHEFNCSIYFFCKAKMIGDALKTYRRMKDMKMDPTVQTYAYLIYGYSSLDMYRDITILWGDVKRNMENGDLILNRDLYELLLLNFLQGGYFERAMEVIGYMKGCNMYIDKLMYKSEFLKLHMNLYRNLKASGARTEAQSKRLEFVQQFKKCVGID